MRQRIDTNDILFYVQNGADELVIERTVDGEEWIATIDDISSDQQPSLRYALKVAYLKWRAHREKIA